MTAAYEGAEAILRRLERAPEGMSLGELAGWLYHEGIRALPDGPHTPRQTEQELVRRLGAKGIALNRLIEELAAVSWATLRAYEFERGYGERLAPWKGATQSDRSAHRALVFLLLSGAVWDGETLHRAWRHLEEENGREWGPERTKTTHPWLRDWTELPPVARTHWNLIAVVVLAAAPEGVVAG